MADVYTRDVLRGVPFSVLLPPQLSGWSKVKLWFQTIPAEMRYRWRMTIVLPGKKRLGKGLLNLWKRGLLERMPSNPDYYRLKH